MNNHIGLLKIFRGQADRLEAKVVQRSHYFLSILLMRFYQNIKITGESRRPVIGEGVSTHNNIINFVSVE